MTHRPHLDELVDLVRTLIAARLLTSALRGVNRAHAAADRKVMRAMTIAPWLQPPTPSSRTRSAT